MFFACLPLHEEPIVRYAQIIHTILERPWAVQRQTLQTIVRLVAYRASGHVLTEEEVRERLAAAPPRARRESAGVIAVIPVHGVIVPRASLFTEMSGATSVEGLARSFREAMASPDVGALVFDVDSPGGMVDGIPEFAAEIRAARGTKPMSAVSNFTSASAAYWLAAQADEVVAAPSSFTGSIGVFSAHEDASKFWDELGIKTTLISSGKYKVEGNEFEPLSDEARDFMQSVCDDYYGMFVNDIAKGRGVAASAVRSGYGQGRALTAKRALSEGLVDRIDTLDGVIGRLARQVVTNRGSRALGPGWPEVTALVGDQPTPPEIVEVSDDPAQVPGEVRPDEPEEMTAEPVPAPEPDPQPEADPKPAGLGEVEIAKAKARRAARAR